MATSIEFYAVIYARKVTKESPGDKRHRMSWIEQERATALPGLAWPALGARLYEAKRQT